MPPVVDVEEVARGPVADAAVEVRQPFAETTLHLECVHDGMNAPDVLGVALDSFTTDVLAAVVVTRLLEAKSEHPEHERVVLLVFGPGGQDAGNAVAQARGVAGEEVDLMTHGQREGVTRVQVRDLLQQHATTEHVAAEPDGGSLEMTPFAVVQTRQVGSGQPVR